MELPDTWDAPSLVTQLRVVARLPPRSRILAAAGALHGGASCPQMLAAKACGLKTTEMRELAGAGPEAAKSAMRRAALRASAMSGAGTRLMASRILFRALFG